MPAQPRFRRRALEKLSSPEQLDRTLQVTLPRGWIALAALLLALAAVSIWSALATIPTTISGSGYLLPEGGLREMQAPASGTLAGSQLAVGQHVVVGSQVETILGAEGKPTSVAAPDTGVVTEVDSAINDYVQTGSPLALVEPIGWPLVVYAYVPTSVAAGLRVGIPVQVTFGGGIGTRFGYAKGTVSSVGEFPATAQRLNFILRNPSAVSALLRLGPVNEIEISLAQSAADPSGLVWSSGRGPSSALPAGLPAQVKFITGQRHPIDDVL